jgi:hypothetical protein
MLRINFQEKVPVSPQYGGRHQPQNKGSGKKRSEYEFAKAEQDDETRGNRSRLTMVLSLYDLFQGTISTEVSVTSVADRW